MDWSDSITLLCVQQYDEYHADIDIDHGTRLVTTYHTRRVDIPVLVY